GEAAAEEGARGPRPEQRMKKRMEIPFEMGAREYAFRQDLVGEQRGGVHDSDAVQQLFHRGRLETRLGAPEIDAAAGVVEAEQDQIGTDPEPDRDAIEDGSVGTQHEREG